MKEFIIRVIDPEEIQWYEEEPETPELIRCKDCINCVKEPNGDLYCDILAIGYEPLGSKKVTDDWFCADGKRKEDRSRKADDTIPRFDDSIGRMPEL